MPKLSKANTDTLELLKLGIGKVPGISDELMETLKSTILAIKEDASSTRDRKPRSISNIFSPTAANIFKLRIVEGKSQPDVEKELDLEGQKVASGVREVGYKLVAHLLKDEELGESVTAKVNEFLVTFATGKERASKDDVVDAPSGEAVTASTETETEPEDEETTSTDEELEALLAAE